MWQTSLMTVPLLAKSEEALITVSRDDVKIHIKANVNDSCADQVPEEFHFMYLHFHPISYSRRRYYNMNIPAAN